MALKFLNSISARCHSLFSSNFATPQRRNRSSFSSLYFGQLEARQLLAGNPIISEFLASNGGSFLDEDGDSSDWVEIFNAGDEAINLNGWSLTDDAQDLTKWSFPSTTLEANQGVLVFASGKDRTFSGSILHSNFRLGADGEYLALVEPDGSTIAFEFAPEFPAQIEDVSYGVAMGGTQTVLVDESTLVRTFVPPDQSLGTAWKDLSFDDSGWDGGPGITAGVGYEGAIGSETSYASVINAPLTPLSTGLASAYARFEFQLTSVADLNQLSLSMQFDDGFIAYLNGAEVESANAPASPEWDSEATAGTPDESATEPVEFDLTEHLDKLVVGTNVLAFQLLNRTADSSDLLLIPELTVGQSTLVEPFTFGYFANPTPYFPNGSNALGFTSEPDFSVQRGFYDSTFDVTLATETAGADIYYTTNGTDPSETSGTLYTGPVTVDGTTTLRAVAVKDDFFPSTSVTHTYLFASDIISQPSSPNGYPADWGTHSNNGTPFLAVADYEIDTDVVGPGDLFDGIYTSRFEDALTSLPTVSLTMDIDDAFDGETGFYANSIRSGREWERETSVEWLDPTGGSEFQVNAGIRAHGGVSRQPWRTPKHGLRLYFRDDYGPGRLNFPLFGTDEGVTSFDRLVFRSHYNDSWQAVSSALHTRGQFVQDPFVRNSFADMGNLSIRSRPVNVYINGLYWGVYDITERPDAEYFADHLGGDSADYDVITARGSVQDGSRDGWDELINLVRTTDLSTTAGYEAVKEKLDVQNLVDYMLVNFYAGVDDWPHNNWVAAQNRVEGGGFRFYVWDAEISMNQLGSNRTGVDDENSSAELYDRLRVNADFRQLFIDRAQLHLSNGGALTPDVAIQRYSELGELVKPALVAESARWGDVHPTVPLSVDNQWQSEFDWIIDTYLPQRTDIFINQLQNAGLATNLAAPQFDMTPGQVPSGTNVDLVNNQSGATLFYTLDGSDPRDSGGGLSSSALSYSGPIAVSDVMTIAMRVRSGNDWSGIVSGSFVLAEPANVSNLRVSELHYHPTDPTNPEMNAGITDADDFEFLELTNIGSETIDLNGVSISGGIDLTFETTTTLQAGEYVVVVADPVAFQLRHGNQARIVGQYSGRLSNGGESLLLSDPDDETILSFGYEDGNAPDEAGWPTTPDGDGPSLVVVDRSGDYSDPANWRPSALADGTPGAPGFMVVDLYRDGQPANSINQLARPDQLGTIEARFDQDVSIDANDLTIRNLTTGGTVVDTSSVGFSYDMGARIATWNFSGSLLLDAAFYSFELSDTITSVGSGLALSGGHAEPIYVAIPGDLNLDGDVDVSQIVIGPGGVQNVGDASILLANLPTATGATYYDGDLNGDGDVDITQIVVGSGGVTNVGDASILLANLGRSVVPPAASSAALLASSATVAPSATVSLFRQQAMVEYEFPDSTNTRHDASLAGVEMPGLASSIELIDEYFADEALDDQRQLSHEEPNIDSESTNPLTDKLWETLAIAFP